MIIKNSESKKFIFDLVYMTGDRDMKGAPIARTSFKNEYWKAASTLRERLVSQIEVEVLRLDSVVWVGVKDIDKTDQVLRERFNNEPFELEGSELATVEYYVKQAKERPLVSSVCFEELSGLI